MKAISLWQPWASLMMLGEKKIETRIWTTKHRGPLAIHAASKMPASWLGQSRNTREFGEELSAVLHVDFEKLGPAINKMPRGVILCVVNVISIEPTEKVVGDLPARERVFGNYDVGRYAWHTELMDVFTEPIPAKGNRLLWEWKGDFECGHARNHSCLVCSGILENYDTSKWIGGKWIHRYGFGDGFPHGGGNTAPKIQCSHKCHQPPGLNPWVEVCIVCGCANTAYDPNAELPDWLKQVELPDGLV